MWRESKQVVAPATERNEEQALPEQQLLPAQQQTPTNEPAVDPHLLELLTTRDVMRSSAVKLLAALPPERIDGVQDYIEFWDSQKRAGKEVGPAWLYDLIKKGDPLPSYFETSRQRAERKAADEKRERLIMAKQKLEFEYHEYRRAELDRYISEVLPKAEYDQLLAAERESVSSQHNFWSRNLPPETLEDMAIGSVRRDMRNGYQFCRSMISAGVKRHAYSRRSTSHPPTSAWQWLNLLLSRAIKLDRTYSKSRHHRVRGFAECDVHIPRNSESMPRSAS